MVYLIVGLDRNNNLEPWHGNVAARDVASAENIGRDRARSHGVDLVLAAVIGPGPAVMPGGARGLRRRAA